MSKEKDPVTIELCEAYRKTLLNEIGHLDKKVDSVDKRLWATLTGVIISILLLIVNLVK